ncbi:MAG: response regulator [Eubacterium sp.]|nr:response regulator [Eubacterium sp.]
MKKIFKMTTGKLIAVVVIYLVLTLVLTFFFWQRSRELTDDQLASEIIDVGRCAADSIDGDLLATIDSDDKTTQAYQTIYNELSVFLDNTTAKYIYAMGIGSGNHFYFLIDTDPNDPGAYGEKIECTAAMAEAAKGIPSVDEEPYEDRWGIFYSSYCPVYDSSGAMAGLVGVDFPADWYESEITQQSNRVLLICGAVILISVLIIVLILWHARREAKSRLIERDELQVAKADAMAANHAKNRFLANMSKEIRTPIETILNMDEMILRESVESDVRDYAMDIRHSGNELLALMEEVLDVSQIESDETELHPIRYNPVLLISDLTDMVQTRIHEKDIKVFSEIDDKLPSILLGDSARIRQCLTGLAVNSVKFTEHGEIHLTVERVRIRENSVWLKFSVRDTGGGISGEEITRIHEALENIEKVRYTMEGGTAMSLSIVNRVLKLMGSKLELESEIGKGSTFFFVLRQKVVDERPIGEYEKAREVMSVEEEIEEYKPYTAPDCRILLVDDAKMNLKLVQILLRDTQITVDTTDSGGMALEMMAQTEYDALIFDHMMPEIDGVELLRLVRENRENANCSKPCIVLTGNTIEGAREHYLKVGFDAYLGKPVQKDLLEGILYRYLPADKIHVNEFMTR